MAEEKKKPRVGDEEIVRINIMRGSKRTSVSMDAFLAELLEQRLDKTSLQEWAANCAERLDAKRERRRGQPTTRSGLSRLIQREALKAVLGLDGAP